MRTLTTIVVAIAFAFASPSPVSASWTRADVDTGRQLLCNSDAGYWYTFPDVDVTAYICPGSDAGA